MNKKEKKARVEILAILLESELTGEDLSDELFNKINEHYILK